MRTGERNRREKGWFTPAAEGAGRPGLAWPCAGLVALVLLFVCPKAQGDVGVVLNDSLGRGIARVTGSGHSGVYFSRICPASPVELRLCAPGEEGSVISTYSNFGEDSNYEWNVVPLNVYLYGVEDARERPLFASDQIKEALEEEYREKFLASQCASPACRTNKDGQWRAMVGAALTRTVYVFVVETTVEQDLEFIAQFNQRPNRGRFNGLTWNCADFTREVINMYFPKATRRNYLNDFGMTSPKGIARSFAKFARSSADSQFRVLHFPQVAGTTKRSSGARAGTEQIFRSKKLLIPTLIFQAPAAAASAVTYFLTGRFNPQRELERYPTARAAEIEHERQIANSQRNSALAEELAAERKQEREEILGSSEDWDRYREEFADMVEEAAQTGLIASRKALRDVFKGLDQQGQTVRGDDGAMWLEIRGDGGVTRVGLSTGNVLSEESDLPLAYRLMLARVNEALESPPRTRPAMTGFAQDWRLLQQARETLHVWQASAAQR